MLPTISWRTDSHTDSVQRALKSKIVTQWLADHKSDLNIVGDLVTGDFITNNNITQEWAWSRDAEDIIRAAGIRQFFVPGNHDYYTNRLPDNLQSHYPNNNFPYQTLRTANRPSDGMYGFLYVGRQPFLVVGLEPVPSNACVEWADGVLKANSAFPAIILTHEFLYPPTGGRYDYAAYGSAQYWNDGNGALPGWDNDGEKLWSKAFAWNSRGLIRGNNVRLVLCGHTVDNAETGSCLHVTNMLDNGLPCHQMVANYQFSKGSMSRLLTFDIPNDQIITRTVNIGTSPAVGTTQDWIYVSNPNNDFVISNAGIR